MNYQDNKPVQRQRQQQRKDKQQRRDFFAPFK